MNDDLHDKPVDEGQDEGQFVPNVDIPRVMQNCF